MKSVRDLSKAEASKLYEKLADLVDELSEFMPTRSTTGIIHHGENMMTSLETHLAAIDPLLVPTKQKAKTS